MPPVAVAFLISLIAGFAVAEKAMPLPRSADETAILLAQAEGGRTYRRDDWREQQRPRVHQELRGVIADCHPDVRTHRINGVIVTHRHVGDNCAVRVVRRATEPAPGG